jgi:hypothetical protein
MTITDVLRRPPSDHTNGVRRPLLVLVLGLCLGAATLAGVLSARGSANPLGDPTHTLLASVLPGGWVSLVVLLAGGLGAVVAGAALARGASWTAPGLITVGLVELAVFGVAVQGMQALSLAGYLTAMALPVGLVVIGVQTGRRYPRLRWPLLAGTAVLVGTGVGVGLLRPGSVRQLVGDLGAGFARTGITLGVTVLFLGTAMGWVAVIIDALASTGAGHRATVSVTRHRRLLTVLAALGPLPYGLLRMSWLTPWPLGTPGGVALAPDMRLWGLLLGGSALLGVVLTIGLIRPWGERFPRWMPRLAGRSVPIAAAAVPGGVVATIVSAAAVPMLISMTFAPSGAGVTVAFTLSDRVLSALIFPCWFWGPMLALAIWAYVGHRRASRPVSGQTA